VIPSRFGESGELSVGVEEELMLLDVETLELTDRAEDVIARLQPEAGEVKLELHASVVEITSGACDSVDEAVARLRRLRAQVREAAAEIGATTAAAGSHPTSEPEAQRIARDARYEDFVAWAGVTAQRQAVNGLHVHVGVSSADDCWCAVEGLLPWLPLVLALSANSPYVGGRDTGLASTRAETLGLLPRAGAPAAFGSYGAWEAYAERLVALGLADSYTRIWWDVRPHPRFGTVEVRVADQPTAIERTAALAALVRGLVSAAVGGETAPPAADRAFYSENRWSALRLGSQAQLVHPDGDRVSTVPELLAEACERAGVAVGNALDPSSSEADRQRAIGAARGLRAVCEDLVERT
jgi:carboxylate-amine ligase